MREQECSVSTIARVHKATGARHSHAAMAPQKFEKPRPIVCTSCLFLLLWGEHSSTLPLRVSMVALSPR